MPAPPTPPRPSSLATPGDAPARESRLHALIQARSLALGPRVAVGPGDDAAVVLADESRRVLVTIDHLIEGRHILGPLSGAPGIGHGVGPATPTDAAARKAIARSVSDLAAMAATPAWALATAALPPGFPQSVADHLFECMSRWATHWGCPLVGGDIATLPDATDPVVLTVTVGGDAHRLRGPVLRRGAAPGDTLFVTGRIGASLDSGRHLTFEPRLREARWLADTLGDRLHAMIDLSDGVGRDAARLADASGARVRIEAPRVPLHEGVVGHGLGDGEDYELLFAAAPGTPVPDRCPQTGTPITPIGRVEAGAGCVVAWADGRETDASELGWDH